MQSQRPTVRLKIDRRSAHPWIFQKMIERPPERIPPGSIVDVVDRSGNQVGKGFYNGHSRIGLRMLTDRPDQVIDDAFFEERIEAAIRFRVETLGLPTVTNAFRLVHSEADHLSGLVVDRFADVIVIEFFSAGMARLRETIIRVLESHFPGSRFYWFAEEHVQKQESFDVRSPEPPRPVVIEEHGIRFKVAPGSKHKTGFFLDQRENRRFLASLCRGRRVLDLCCNTGGFAIYSAVLGDAADVTGVDLDEQALALARQNAQLNRQQIRFVQADLFTWLRDILPSGQRFDVVVLDPSKQTRDRDSVDVALKRYYDMNRLALQAVAPGGVVLSCSCTGLVSEPMFLETLRRAAWQAGRRLQVFRLSGAASDHPFLLHVPEGRYLKAVFARVE